MIRKTSRALTALAALLLAFVLTPTPAQAVFERVGPVSATNGYPIWYQDKTGITLELCTPTTAAELAGGYCLLLPADLPVIPEVFPTNWFDEHFYWDGSAVVDLPLAPGATKAGRAVLVQALEGAFATGPVIPGEQIVFGRFRFDFRDLPLSGTYTIYTPFGIRVFPNLTGGVNTRLFYTEDIGLSCPLGDFTCALQAGVGPFLLPSNTPGGAELAPFADPAIPGKLYIADPARLGPVTGSTFAPYVTPLGTFNANMFRVEVTTGTGVVEIVSTTDFGLQGRLFQQPIQSRVTIDRASYARSAANNISVDVYATGEPTIQPRLPGNPVVPAAFPGLALFDSPCGGTLAADGVTILPPFTAPAGGVSIPMPRFGTAYYGHTTPAAVPAGVCVVDLNAKDVNGNVVPHYDPAPLGDQVFISEAYYDPANSTLNVFATSSDDLFPPQLSVGAFGALAANQPLTAGAVTIPAVTAPPANVRVLSQEGGVNSAQVKIGRRPASGVTLSVNLPSPQAPGTAVVFTAAGQGSSGYEYRFLFNTNGVWAVVQDFSPVATWALPTNTPAGSYQVQVEVRTTPTVALDAASPILPYVLRFPPATGVTVAANVASPSAPGIPVVFTAAGQGSGGYQYRFWLNTNGVWAIVQEYGIGSTYTLPGTTPVGTYFVAVEVRTSTTVVRDAVSANLQHVIQNAPATGVVVTASHISPQPPGTPVVFTAAGQGSSGYQYRFWFNNGVAWSVVQDWSTTNTWPLPTSTGAGNYLVSAEVRTSTAVARDAVSANLAFTIAIAPATGVTLSVNVPSPQAPGSTVIFTAAGQGSSGYQYRFWFNNGITWSIVQDWNVTSTWQLPLATPAGSYLVAAEVRTTPTVARDAVSSNLAFVLSNPPATGVTVSAAPASPSTQGTPVVFTAAGTGSSGYQYEFWFMNGVSWVLVQNYGVGNTWTLPGTTAAGTYQVAARVRTTTLVAQDAVSPNLTHIIQ